MSSLGTLALYFLFFITLFSFLVTLYALFEPVWLDAILVSAPCMIAGLFLLLRRLERRESQPVELDPHLKERRRSQRSRRTARPQQPQKPQKRAIIDGSNVMHWQDGDASYDPLHDVVRKLKSLGYAPGVMFDANVGHVLEGRYLDDASMAARLQLPENAVVVVAKGTPADPVILAAARDIRAVVVTNDRFRDWAKDFPEVRKPGFLIRGGYNSGKLWLDQKIHQA